MKDIMYGKIKVLVISSIVLLLVVSMGVAAQDSPSERESMGFTG